VSRGRVVVEGGELKAARGSGEFIPRGEPEPVQTATGGPSGGTALKGLLGIGRSR
jgi:hypothetical protein